jgi:hypothetical protein
MKVATCFSAAGAYFQSMAYRLINGKPLSSSSTMA